MNLEFFTISLLNGLSYGLLLFMQGGTVGEVVESCSPRFQPGDKVVGMTMSGRYDESLKKGGAYAHCYSVKIRAH